jgi:undecaprenyl-diphosphatase
MSPILELDKDIFIFLNGFYFPLLDHIMLGITHRLTWIPLYVYIIYVLYLNKSISPFWISIFTIIFAAGLSDFITSGLMKPLFMRLRPCHEPELMSIIHQIGGCGGNYGFASSHAANTFALSFSFFLMFKNTNKKLSYILIIWAIVVSYSRIYVGVHYPLDILVGAGIGTISAILFNFIKTQINSKKL